jgi:hypothetical protein
MSEKQKKETKPTEVKALDQENKDMKNVFVRGIIGITLLLVFGSIAFSTVVIWTGTDNPVYKLLIAPQALFAGVIAFVAFSKILK